MAVRWETKRPNEVRDYQHDWSAFLDGDTIATSDVTVSGVTLDSDSNDTDSVTIWVSGGTDGSLATATNTITTAAGRTETEVFTFHVRSASEPVSLSTAKAHLRVLDDHEDTLISGYIRAAREWVENYTGHILVRRPITQAFGGFTSYLELHHRPIVDVTAIDYFDADGAPQALADYAVTTGRYPYRIYPDELPSTLDNSSVIVTYLAGYAEGDEPQALVQAMLLLIGHWFANREAVGEVKAEVPFAVYSLCDQYRTPVL